MTTPEALPPVILDEPIGKPLQFLRDNPELVENIEENEFRVANPKDHRIISAPDWDVLIERSGSWCKRTEHQSTQPASASLGSLYMKGAVQGLKLNGQRYTAQWYPSATHTNRMLERLGEVPGDTCLRVVQATHTPDEKKQGELTARRYVEYFARAEYPQAMRRCNFQHDRDDDHVLGIFLLPPTVTANIVSYAAQAVRARRRKATGGTQARVVETARSIDDTTAEVRRMVEPGLTKAARLDAALIAVGQKRGAFANDNPLSAQLWDLEYTSDRETAAKAAAVVTKRVHARLDQLRPKIKELQEAA